MDDKLAILLENLRETLRRADSYGKLATGAAIFFLMLAHSWQSRETVAIPGFPPIDRVLASEFLLTVFWISTGMAAYSLERARTILRRFSGDRELFDAVLTYPAFATERWPLVRLAPAVLPFLLVVIGAADAGFLKARGSVFIAVPAVVIGVAPSLVLFLELNNFGQFIPKG